MNRDDIRIDVRDDDGNIHEVYITTDGELVIWTMDRHNKVTSKSYGKIHPDDLGHRGVEMIKLSRKLLKDES